MNYKLTDSEREVMEKIWMHSDGIRQSELLAEFNEEGIDWKRQTLNTFITHLEEKGLIEREKRIVYPLLTKQEYINYNVIEMIEDAYDGMISNLVTAFSSKKKLSEKDIKHLKDLLDDYGREDA